VTSAVHASDDVDPVVHVDVLIVGAGISGIGAAYRLQEHFPEKSFVILEAMDNRGGTWLLHRYPGVRSDSDLFTFGYSFKPWRGASIAGAKEILAYLDEVIEENNLAERIHYRHRVTAASWSSQKSRWTVEVSRLDTGEHRRFTANFLWMCQGYYKHSEGYTPEWPGMERFRGRVVHPQSWPGDLDYASKRVVVIGSGATAATILPELAKSAEHITMLQRTPTFFVARPNPHELAVTLKELETPDEWTHEIMRRFYIRQYEVNSRNATEQPEVTRKNLIEEMRRLLPEGFDVDRHFNPPYRPFQQRIAVAPNGDLFAAISSGKASVVTDTIKTFVESGIELTSGTQLEADIIVTATGFDLEVFGGIAFTVDDEPVDLTERVTYRGIMITGMPNMAYVFGYFRASWTLRADLVSLFICRLLAHMHDTGAKTVVPQLREEDDGMTLLPWADPENFNAGYVMRNQHKLWKRGAGDPWTHWQEYHFERYTLPEVDLDDGLVYS
jgi:monooxygenase